MRTLHGRHRRTPLRSGKRCAAESLTRVRCWLVSGGWEFGAGGGNRTHTGGDPHGILSPKTAPANIRNLALLSENDSIECHGISPNITATGEGVGEVR